MSPFYFEPQVYEGRWMPVSWYDDGVPDQRGLSHDDVAEIAQSHGIPPAHLDALIHVEAGRAGFLLQEPPPARPKILYEAHHFFRRSQHGARVHQEAPSLSSPHWDRRLYLGGSREWDERLSVAAGYDLEAALESCSWGLGQIMGEHWKMLSYLSIHDFVIDAFTGEKQQIDQMVWFIKASGILDDLRNGHWEAVARRYNGAAFHKNQYDVKLARAAHTSEFA